MQIGKKQERCVAVSVQSKTSNEHTTGRYSVYIVGGILLIFLKSPIGRHIETTEAYHFTVRLKS